MVERQAITRLNREFVILQKANCPQFLARPSENDTLTWHYCIFGLPKETPYYGGQYHGKLIFPREYPLKPPSILMLTPSGRFEVNTRLCLSMSDFHPETWNPSWRVETILLGLVSFMCDESDPATAGGIHTSISIRQNEALLSFFRNRRSKDFREMFPTLIEPHSYIIGIGYVTKSSSETGVRLDSLGLNDRELDSVSSLDALRILLKTKGVEGQSADVDRGNNSDKSLFNLAPWLAVAVISGVWLYSQIRLSLH